MLFNHAAMTGETDWEIRAAVLRSAYGRGLVYTCTAKCNQALGYYGGESISLQEYWQLHEDNGLRHTLLIRQQEPAQGGSAPRCRAVVLAGGVAVAP